jgi:hypothetical protein
VVGRLPEKCTECRGKCKLVIIPEAGVVDKRGVEQNVIQGVAGAWAVLDVPLDALVNNCHLNEFDCFKIEGYTNFPEKS